MEKYEFTKEDVAAVMKEFARRMSKDIKDGYIEPGEENRVWEERMQGVWGTLMALSANWPEVADWTEKVEIK